MIKRKKFDAGLLNVVPDEVLEGRRDSGFNSDRGQQWIDDGYNPRSHT